MLYGIVGRNDLEGNLLSIGLITYEDACVQEVVSRLGDEFTWNLVNFEPQVRSEIVTRMIEFELEDWHKTLAVISLIMNFFVIILFAIYIGFRCK